jgi:4-diphosphocytidyl-2-C-methyl-D-erythritol kinase
MKVRRARLKSLAKINLNLRVLNRRADGFHEIRTVFQTISLADRIDIEYQPARRTEIFLEDPLAIPDNLVVRAAQRVLGELRLNARVHLRLRKRIPMGAGLGGGSSNAAAILLALPVLAGRTIPLERLELLAAALGSDVPFFLLGGTALGFGRGEEVYPLPDIARKPILVVSTGLHVSTPAAYQALGRGLTFTESSRYIDNFRLCVRELADGFPGRAPSANDFESVVFRQYPQLKHILGKLSKLALPGVRMTGSGSGIFAVFRSAPDRARALKVLEEDRVFRGCRMLAASIVSRRGYRRLWRNQLREHLNAGIEEWPPLSRYAR